MLNVGYRPNGPVLRDLHYYIESVSTAAEMLSQISVGGYEKLLVTSVIRGYPLEGIQVKRSEVLVIGWRPLLFYRGLSTVINTALSTSRSLCPEGRFTTSPSTTKVLDEPPSRLMASRALSSMRRLASRYRDNPVL